MTRVPKRRLDTEKGYVMVEFSNVYSCWIWRDEWGHIGFDFESEAEAIRDYQEHHCDRRI
jgi:hypothetical protein